MLLMTMVLRLETYKIFLCEFKCIEKERDRMSNYTEKISQIQR
jgi:hypothetical protein